MISGRFHRDVYKRMKPPVPQTPVGGEPMKHEDVEVGMRKYDVWKIHSNVSIEYEWYFDDILYRIKRGDNFTFIRLCDGDYHNMFFLRSPDGKMDQDSINIAAKSELYLLDIKNKRLNDGIEEDNLIVGMQFGTQYDKEFIDPLKKYVKVCNDGYSSALFSWAYATDNIEKLFFLLTKSERPIIIVGPEYLSNIDRFNIDSHIYTPEEYSWLNQEEIDQSLENEIKHYINRGGNPIILYACSVSGKISISKFYEKYGSMIVQLDMGSNLNPYADKPIRGWQMRENKKDSVDLFEFYGINRNLGAKIDYRNHTISTFCSDVDPFSKDFILSNINEGDVLVEIGVHGGYSLLKAFDLIEGRNIKIYGIDCWEDIEKIGINGVPNDFFTESSLKEFLDLHKLNRIGLENIVETYDKLEQIRLIKGFSYDKKIIELFDDESISYLYIDGDHSYSGCYNDLKNWYPKVKKGGLIMGDDGNLPGVREAVNDFCGIEKIYIQKGHNKFYFIK